MLDGCTVDDEMWYHALMTMARLESEVCPDLQNQRPEEWVLYQLIRRGVIDQDDNRDKVFHPVCRSRCSSSSGESFLLLLNVFLLLLDVLLSLLDALDDRESSGLIM